MRLPNRHGSAVDPVPFVVVTGLAWMVLLSFGPLYGQALGVPLPVGLGVSTALSLVATAGAYYSQVWTATPEIDGELPSGLAAERLFYLMLVLAVLIVALAIPLLV